MKITSGGPYRFDDGRETIDDKRYYLFCSWSIVHGSCCKRVSTFGPDRIVSVKNYSDILPSLRNQRIKWSHFPSNRLNYKDAGAAFEESDVKEVMMKLLRWSVVPILVLLLLPVYSFPQTLGTLRISLIEGDIQMKIDDTEDWVPASINMPLKEGDVLWVPEGGRAELQLQDGTLLRLGAQSALEILTLQRDSSQFYLTEGRLYANFVGLKENLLQIDTQVSSVRAYDRSMFSVDASQGRLDISVFQGSVYAETKDGTTRVAADKVLSLGEDDYAELSPLGPPDDWERWNKSRDRKYAEQRPPSRYLPDELSAYSRDLDRNGRWVHTPEYGYVWTPTAVVSAGWAPYKVGRWVWVGSDYVWISYERWGWVPYHYGRWAFVGAIGWCWVPPARGAVYWGPGFVGWVQTPTYVSWVPLAPGEIYYGHGHYGPHSVNIANVNIARIQAQRIVYRNVHARNAVTVIHHDTFVTGRKVEVRVRENPFLKERVRIGRPDIRPERATIMPVLREIPQAKRPPETIRQIQVKEIRERRPLAREREISVLRPGLPPRELPVRSMEKRSMERPIGFEKPKPLEKGVEKPKEFKPIEAEKSKDYKAGERPREVKPSEKAVERSKTIEKGIVKPGEFKKPEAATEKTKDYQGDQPKQMQPLEKKIEKPKAIERVEKPKEIQAVEPEKSKSYKSSDKRRELNLSEQGTEKPKPSEKALERRKAVEKQREKMIQKREPKKLEKETGKPD